MSYGNYIPRSTTTSRRPQSYSVRHANAHPDVVQAWREKFPAEWEWLEAGARRDNEFACSLIAHLNRKGTLTDGQHACVTRSIAQAPIRAAEKAAREANSPNVEIHEIEAAFSRARAAGVKRPKLTFADFRFTAAPMTGVNPGAIYIKSTEDSTYLGKVANGRFVRSRDCSNDLANAAVNVMADPRAAAIAYGLQFGVCCICSRTLTDPASVAIGIGPVCAKRMGWE